MKNCWETQGKHFHKYGRQRAVRLNSRFFVKIIEDFLINCLHQTCRQTIYKTSFLFFLQYSVFHF